MTRYDIKWWYGIFVQYSIQYSTFNNNQYNATHKDMSIRTCMYMFPHTRTCVYIHLRTCTYTQELFTKDGNGLLISRDMYEGIRPATVGDIAGIIELVTPFIEKQVG